MKNIYFVEPGIYEYFDKKGRPAALNDDEIQHIVKPLAADIKHNIIDDKMTLISSNNNRKCRQAAAILGKTLGGLKPIYCRELNLYVDASTFEDIIKSIPMSRNQIIMFGINNIDNLLMLFNENFGDDLIENIESLVDKSFCPYEIRKVSVTNKCLSQMKQFVTH